MGFLWALGGIAAGTLVATLAGAILDYAQRLGWIVATGEQWLLLPVVTGLSGLLGSLISVSMYGKYLRERNTSHGPAAGASKAATKAPRGMEYVPGMPVFDVESINRGDHRTEIGGTGVSPADPTGQRPAPPPEQRQ